MGVARHRNVFPVLLSLCFQAYSPAANSTMQSSVRRNLASWFRVVIAELLLSSSNMVELARAYTYVDVYTTQDS